MKRGFGITLEESLNAAEYLASEGNRNVVFCLRGVKTNMGDPHRNLVDFAHIAAVKRLTRMPVCIDPSHAVGSRGRAPDGILDVLHATAQGIIAGANMVLADFHPHPAKALVDGRRPSRSRSWDRFSKTLPSRARRMRNGGVFMSAPRRRRGCGALCEGCLCGLRPARNLLYSRCKAG